MTADSAYVPLEGLRRVLGDPDQGGIIDRLIEAGNLPKPNIDGRIDLLVVVPAFFAELRASLNQNTAGAAAERARVARADAQELRLAEEQRELVQVDDGNLSVDIVCGAILTALTGLPARVTRDLAVRRQIEDMVRKAQIAMADELDES